MRHAWRTLLKTVAAGVVLGMLPGTVSGAGPIERRQPPEPAEATRADWDEVERAKDSRANLAVAQERQPRTPMYQPPRMSAPAPQHRRGGGTRGDGVAHPVIVVLAPSHTGLTLQAQPDLYWFTTRLGTPTPVVFTLLKGTDIAPALEVELPFPETAGIQKIHLAGYGISLEEGEEYQWSVALVPDPDHRSKDVVAMGAIKRIPWPGGLTPQPASHTSPDAASVYASAGLWYDALMAVSYHLDGSRESTIWRSHRAALLDQVGLAGVTADQRATATRPVS